MQQVINDLTAQGIVTSVITSSRYSSAYSDLYTKTGGIYANLNSGNFQKEMLKLAENIVDYTISDMSLHLSEPRLLYNLSVCYLADDETSQSASYRNSIKRMMDAYAKLLAQATDGHVLINKVLLMPTNFRMNFYTITDPASMADIRIETREKDDGSFWFNVQIRSNAHVDGFYDVRTVDNEDSLSNWSSLRNPTLQETTGFSFRK